MPDKPNDKQVGGQHYKSEFQHWDFAILTNNRYLESCVSKYVTRWRNKDGIKDLEKAEHYCTKLMEAALDKLILPPALAVSKFQFHHYAMANELDEEQLAIVAGVHTWASVARLHAVHVRLQNYIKGIRAAAARPAGYVVENPESEPGKAYVDQ